MRVHNPVKPFPAVPPVLELSGEDGRLSYAGFLKLTRFFRTYHSNGLPHPPKLVETLGLFKESTGRKLTLELGLNSLM